MSKTETWMNIDLPSQLADGLKMIVDTAQANKTMTLYCAEDTTFGSPGKSYIISAPNKGGNLSSVGDPIVALECLGFIRFLPASKMIFITLDAFEWHQYQQRSRISRWIMRLWNQGHSLWLAGISLLAVILTILQIFQLFHMI